MCAIETERNRQLGSLSVSCAWCVRVFVCQMAITLQIKIERVRWWSCREEEERRQRRRKRKKNRTRCECKCLSNETVQTVDGREEKQKRNRFAFVFLFGKVIRPLNLLLLCGVGVHCQWEWTGDRRQSTLAMAILCSEIVQLLKIHKPILCVAECVCEWICLRFDLIT